MDVVEREMGLIAEMALGARSLREFESDWLAHLRRAIGFETACSVWTGSDAAVRSVTAVGYGEALLREHFMDYMGELSPGEIAGFSAKQPALDCDVLSAKRRRELRVYRELLAPLRVSCFVTNVWHSRWGVFGFHLARTCGARRFDARELTRLSSLAPCVKLGQALFAAETLGQPLAAFDADWWAHAWQLSAREIEVARLVVRGFFNPEIARLLRVSPHTVRNHLASIFFKASVSSRAELGFAMSAPPELSVQRRSERLASRGAWKSFVASTGSGAEIRS